MDNAVSSVASQTLSDSLAKRVIKSALQRLSNGYLSVTDHDGTEQYGDRTSNLHADIHVINPAFYRQVLLGGSIGAGEAYIAGDWQSSDLTRVIQLFARNLPILEQVERTWSWAVKPFTRLGHLVNRNSVTGSKRNIVAHYDLGNEMYQQFLDSEMLYSSAIYPDEHSDLEQAQQHKLAMICERLDLRPGMTLLEIGTGWGALAIYAAQHYGVKVTTTTISDEQYAYARQRVQQLGLEDQVTLLTEDYRHLSGQYDRLVSIEMIEAVGHEYLPGFFNKLNQLLNDQGRLLIQAITISDQRYDQYRKGVDFIQKYIFPGGCLPSVSLMAQLISKQSDMVILGLDDIGRDYGRTLAHWHEKFDHAREHLQSLGYGDDFIRMWKFYLSYCEGGFIERTTSAVHLVAVKPGYRLAPVATAQQG
ncbi:cyclopropane-fatty-acyl-phospholipid synthase family protein [Shewanella sp. NIFS-20-20]|uniref:SAM-dependent methyltransferase n=1 Tax=Shewanella sp. NIFS-20-20 TaxID=2853806 RepID=UPI001C48C98A|nr:cyclopropane-fatty-acyl-phospholipid synthase family protein [Shewanella sp. NIFS-20-20]MBV7314512.1 cyclopropane-fatty-acyl-phospholipid synthase family protein [Shewanella sp. NIFS-20-20]